MAGRSSSFLTLGALLALINLAITTSSAKAEEGDWDFEVGIYVWLPTISGTLKYDIPGLGDTIEVDPSTLIENLQFTAMGAFEATRGPWGFFTDVVYLKEAKSGNKKLDVGRGTELDSEFALKSWVINFGAGYEVARLSNGGKLGVLAGARYFDLESSLALQAGGPLAADETGYASSKIWNGVIGVDGRVALGTRWYIPYYLDVGTGDSDITWQGLAGVGHEWSWGRVDLSWRHLDFDQGSSSAIHRMTLSGAELGLYFAF